MNLLLLQNGIIIKNKSIFFKVNSTVSQGFLLNLKMAVWGTNGIRSLSQKFISDRKVPLFSKMLEAQRGNDPRKLLNPA